jgi:hypothetical protein
MSNFKPNLIPNNPKDGSFDMDKVIKKNGGYDKYIINLKKDGVRVQLLDGQVLSRALKVPGSKLVVDRFQPLADEFKKLGINVDAEFYMHGQKFNSIFRFFSKSDVTTEKYRIELAKAYQKDAAKFRKDYDGLEIGFLTEFHNELQIHIFDGILTDAPEITGYLERMEEIQRRVMNSKVWANIHFCFQMKHVVSNKEELDSLYEQALENGFEGLVLTHKDHKYKYGRNSLNEGTILKMKDDAIEYDAVVIDVEEATAIKEGVERTINELGRSVTSKKKGDRENSGIAKGFIVAYCKEDGTCIGTFTVCLTGFNHDERREIFSNRAKYIGRHFSYTGMAPVKDFPRHAYFANWRDEKGEE